MRFLIVVFLSSPASAGVFFGIVEITTDSAEHTVKIRCQAIYSMVKPEKDYPGLQMDLAGLLCPLDNLRAKHVFRA